MGKRRTSAHQRVQKMGKVRDGFTCQICGSTGHVEGHHIIEYQYNGAADLDNIVTLCHKHHRDVHDGFIDLFKF